jgi:hypothetical protein
MFRLRFDAGYDLNRPDRAEFFYAEWHNLSVAPHGINGDGVFFDPRARGPAKLPGNVNYQGYSAYLEYAFGDRLSVFGEVPYRTINFKHLEDEPVPEGGSNNPNGFSDLQFGFKAALVACPDRYLTFQFRTYVPTGDPGQGLGTGHVSLEPGLLFYQRFTDRLVGQAQIMDWIPIDGGSEAGNVLNYGAGLAYDVYQRGNLRITPVAEFIGWTILHGFESTNGVVNATAPPGVVLPAVGGVENASGATIVNGKIGVRTYFGRGNDVYIGWGHALTGSRWYQDIVRVEYRRTF